MTVKKKHVREWHVFYAKFKHFYIDKQDIVGILRLTNHGQYRQHLNEETPLRQFLSALLGLGIAGFVLGMVFFTTGPIDRIGGEHELLGTVDDTGYSLGIARNIAFSNGWTSDGVNQTSGFQPAYVFTMVPVFWMVGDTDLETPVYVALTLLALFRAGAGVFIGLILLRLTRRKLLSLMGAGAFQLWPYGIAIGVNGLETSMAWFFLAWTLWYTVRHWDTLWSWHRMFPLGVLLGLGLWVRLDTAIFAVAIGLTLLIRASKEGRFFFGLGRGVALATITIALYAPFMIMAYDLSGSPLPESGPAVRQISIVQHGAEGRMEEYITENAIEASSNALLVSPFLPNVQFLTGVFQHRTTFMGTIYTSGEILWITIGLPGVMLLLIWLWRRPREKIEPKREVTLHEASATIIALYTILMIVAYSTYVFGDYFFFRYFSPLTWMVGVIGTLLLVHSLEKTNVRFYAMMALTAIFTVNVGTEIVSISKRDIGLTYGEKQVLAFDTLLDEGSIQPGDTVGALQSGHLSYWRAHQGVSIINLDGVVNNDAYEAIKHRTFGEYVLDSEISYIIEPWHGLVNSVLRHSRVPEVDVIERDVAGEPVFQLARTTASR